MLLKYVILDILQKYKIKKEILFEEQWNIFPHKNYLNNTLFQVMYGL